MTGPAGDRHFNLDSLLGEKYVRHYLKFIRGPGNQFVVQPGVMPDSEYVPRDGPQPQWRAWAERADAPYGQPPPAALQLRRLGSGPDACSPSGELAPHPGFIWDVCGYYRRLGCSPYATRTQLARAYMARGGQDSIPMTYALHQLLDPERRRRYDATPLGDLFLEDLPTREWLKAKAVMLATRIRAETGKEVQVGEIYREWGVGDVPGADGMPVSEPPGPPSPPEPEPGRLGDSPVFRWQMEWSWWERGSSPLHSPIDLEVWQGLLIIAFREKGLIIPFAVGFGDGEEILVIPSDCQHPLLCLLGKRPPTVDQAIDAVAKVTGRSQ